ncbi:hypothetical protein GUITHDRAFT_136682 [Guillardia theta CCMP2712]|uniref:TNFR-Cys domain-containing protein n=1 Tax=Guillardia theta (strain CCMP2712) TaxID=905079 RepID=L1JK91_GUITC|nr:hypothetical protein GUITHDRAFT_136682 [Guillardia theta CCMP2712]EKX48574.1 hypothetical protein GUITHDRAFT_136682 [Guillardia theta CCMP2712]|eukprot:XP_005835554.1 hypothetical protein GUITHDRAFT_136682 [Guillardia theta CCMP2712]
MTKSGGIRAKMGRAMLGVLLILDMFSCTGSATFTELTSQEDWCHAFTQVYGCNDPYLKIACYECDGGGSIEVPCAECPQGQYRDGCQGTSAGTCMPCTSCGVGYLSQNCSGADAGVCVLACSSGKFSNDNVSCIACPAGKYSVYPSVSACLDCPSNSFSQSGSSSCTHCPSHAQVVSDGLGSHKCVCNSSLAQVLLPPETGCLCQPGFSIDFSENCSQFSGPGDSLILEPASPEAEVEWRQCSAHGGVPASLNTSYGLVIVARCSNASSSLMKNFSNLAKHSYAQVDLWLVSGDGFDISSLQIISDGDDVLNYKSRVIYNSTASVMFHVNYNASHSRDMLELRIQSAPYSSNLSFWGVLMTKISLYDGIRYFEDNANVHVDGWSCFPNCPISRSYCKEGLYVLGGFGQFGRDVVLRKTFTGLAKHTQLRLVVDFLQIDFWNQDRVIISVDGRVVLSQPLIMSEPLPFCGDQFSRYDQNLHRLELVVNHTSSNASVSIGTSLTLPAVEQSWGLANFELYTHHVCDVLVESPLMVQDAHCLACPAGSYKSYPGPQPCSRCPSDLTGWHPNSHMGKCSSSL